MVHVLRQIHRTLAPRGVLLDVHPLPRDVVVEVWHERGRTPVGTLSDATGTPVVNAARAHLRSLVREGLFAVQKHRWFDLRFHFSSVDEWLRRREERGSSVTIPPGVRPRARRLMRSLQGTLVLSERVRATAMERLGP